MSIRAFRFTFKINKLVETAGAAFRWVHWTGHATQTGRLPARIN